MSRSTGAIAFLSLVIFGVGLLACVKSPLPTDPGGVAPKLTLTAFKQEGSQVALIADTKLARIRADRGYVPIELAIVNKGLDGLSLTAESFVLIDDTGARVPAVGRDELIRDYGDIDTDPRLSDFPDVIEGSYASYQRVSSALTPGFDKPMELTLYIPRFSYAVDFLYFPEPAGGVRGRRFDLLMTAPELEDPIVLTFEVGGRAGDGS